MWKSLGEHIEIVGVIFTTVIGLMLKLITDRFKKLESRVEVLEEVAQRHHDELKQELRDIKDEVIEAIHKVELAMAREYMTKMECKWQHEVSPATPVD